MNTMNFLGIVSSIGGLVVEMRPLDVLGRRDVDIRR